MASIARSYFSPCTSLIYRIVLVLQLILTMCTSLIAGHGSDGEFGSDRLPSYGSALLKDRSISNLLIHGRAVSSNGVTRDSRNASRWETPGSWDNCNATICRPLNKYSHLEEMCLPASRKHLSSSNNRTCDLCCPIRYKPTRLENICSSLIKCHNDNLLEETVRTNTTKDCTKIECCATHANFTQTVTKHCNKVARAEGLSFYGLLMGIAAIILLCLAYLMIRLCLRKCRPQKAPGTTDGANDTQPKRSVPYWLHLPRFGSQAGAKPRKVSGTNQAEQGVSPTKSRKLRQRKSAAVSREE